VEPALIALSVVVVVLLAFYAYGRSRRSAPRQSQPTKPERFETTLGEFHDMREALRPLGHLRAASRRDPNGRQ